MRYEKIDGTTHIYVEKGETEKQVLRAIVRASFELARPAGLGWLHFNEGQEMTDEVADQMITLERDTIFKRIAKKLGMIQRMSRTSIVISMDYVQGRQCKTDISRVKKGHFTLANRSYERDRGLPDPMLDRTKEIIAGKQSAGLASTNHMYKGESLTLRLKEYGFTRQNGESDWDFRKRVFPDLFKMDGDRAMEFLQGGSAAEWDEMDKILYLILVPQTRTEQTYCSS